MTNITTRVPIETIQRQHKGHWFSDDSKRFFKSMWDSYGLQNVGSIYAYFVSSEKFNDATPRKYGIRRVNMRNGEFSHKDLGIFEFQAFNTKKQAYSALRKFLVTEPIYEDKIEWITGEIMSIDVYRIPSLARDKVKLEEELRSLKK